MGGISIDNTRIDTSILMEVLERRYARLCANPAEVDKTWAKVAITLGIYPSHLCMIRAGTRLPGPKLLQRLGLRRIVGYEEVK